MGEEDSHRQTRSYACIYSDSPPRVWVTCSNHYG